MHGSTESVADRDSVDDALALAVGRSSHARLHRSAADLDPVDAGDGAQALADLRDRGAGLRL